MGQELPTTEQDLKAAATRIADLSQSQQLVFLENVLKLLPAESKSSWNKLVQESLSEDKPELAQGRRVLNVAGVPNRSEDSSSSSFTFIISDNSLGTFNESSPDFRTFLDTLAQTVVNMIPQTLENLEQSSEGEFDLPNLRNMTRMARARLSRGRPHLGYRGARNTPFWDPSNPNGDAQI